MLTIVLSSLAIHTPSWAQIGCNEYLFDDETAKVFSCVAEYPIISMEVLTSKATLASQIANKLKSAVSALQKAL